MGLIDHIASIPLFQGLPRKQHEDLSMIVIDQVFKRGQMVFSEGDDGNGFYVLISGRVKIFKLSPEGKEQILHIFWGPGEPFGEGRRSLPGNGFPANAETLAESRVFFFPRPAFIELVGKNPTLALNMMAVLSSRLRRLTHLVEDLSLKEVPGRLAAYLLLLSEKNKGTAKSRIGGFQKSTRQPAGDDSGDAFPDSGEDGSGKTVKDEREGHRNFKPQRNGRVSERRKAVALTILFNVLRAS